MSPCSKPISQFTHGPTAILASHNSGCNMLVKGSVQWLVKQLKLGPSHVAHFRPPGGTSFRHTSVTSST